MPGLLDMFDDPNIKKREAKKVISRIMGLIKDTSGKLLIVASIQEGNYAKLVMPDFEKRIMLSNANHSRLNVDLFNNGKQAKVTFETLHWLFWLVLFYLARL